MGVYRKPRAPAKVIVMQPAVVAPRPGMELDAMRFGNSPFGGRAAFDPHPATAFAVQSDLMGPGKMMSASSTPELVFAGGTMPRAATLLYTEQFLGAVADQRELMFQ